MDKKLISLGSSIIYLRSFTHSCYYDHKAKINTLSNISKKEWGCFNRFYLLQINVIAYIDGSQPVS